MEYASGSDEAIQFRTIELALSSESWELALVGRNLTDELVHNFGNATTLSGAAIYATNIEETRAIAIRATYNW